MRDLATYYASLTPAASDIAAAPAVSTGEALFRGGNPDKGIPPCQGCHGGEASGLLTRSEQYAAYPSLRGQYAPYLVARLTRFKNGLPHDSTSDFIMGAVAKTLDDPSIQALAAWLSSLPVTKSL
jgi:cytochrome c553